MSIQVLVPTKYHVLAIIHVIYVYVYLHAYNEISAKINICFFPLLINQH